MEVDYINQVIVYLQSNTDIQFQNKIYEMTQCVLSCLEFEDFPTTDEANAILLATLLYKVERLGEIMIICQVSPPVREKTSELLLILERYKSLELYTYLSIPKWMLIPCDIVTLQDLSLKSCLTQLEERVNSKNPTQSETPTQLIVTLYQELLHTKILSGNLFLEELLILEKQRLHVMTSQEGREGERNTP